MEDNTASDELPFPLLPGESAEEFEIVRRSYFDEYPPFSEIDLRLLNRAAEREWQYIRCTRLFEELFKRVVIRVDDFSGWTADDHKQLSHFERYMKTSERIWRSAWHDIIYLRKARIDEARSLESMRSIRSQNVKRNISPPPGSHRGPRPEMSVLPENQRQPRPIAETKPTQQEPKPDENPSTENK